MNNMTKVNTIYCGDALEILKTLPDCSINCCVTSPPYFGLRDYNVDGQIGLEETPEDYVSQLVDIFKEVKRVLTNDGTFFLNLGDSYAGSKQGRNADGTVGKISEKQSTNTGTTVGMLRHGIGNVKGCKPKDLIGIPWRVAFALQEDGWWLRQDIIWCLSGGTWLYVRSQKGDMPMMVKDIARLNPSKVQLWNGEKWTRLLGMNCSSRKGDEIELVLRSGERISCTPSHKFPTERGLLPASQIVVGDTLCTCVLPEPDTVNDCALDADAAWFAGLYIAEGSRSQDTIQISGHVKETDRFARLCFIAKKYGGSCTITEEGNCQNIRLYGKVLNAIIDTFVSGRTAKDKGFSSIVWRYSNSFIAAMLDGYLSGDGHKDGNRWRLGFTRNYNLERDLRTACARLGYSLTLNLSSVLYNGRRVATFRGEIRKHVSNHHNNKSRLDVVAIRKSRCRNVWDLGVEDEPHLFALASGVLTHNSKPNPMPESVKDRCTKAHEYIFLLAKSPRYYWNGTAIEEDAVSTDSIIRDRETTKLNNCPGRSKMGGLVHNNYEKRNARSVWSLTNKPYKGAHFATFPEELPKRCILAGCPVGGVVLDPFAGSGTTLYVARELGCNYVGIELNPEYVALIEKRMEQQVLF